MPFNFNTLFFHCFLLANREWLINNLFVKHSLKTRNSLSWLSCALFSSVSLSVAPPASTHSLTCPRTLTPSPVQGLSLPHLSQDTHSLTCPSTLTPSSVPVHSPPHLSQYTNPLTCPRTLTPSPVQGLSLPHLSQDTHSLTCPSTLTPSPVPVH